MGAVTKVWVSLWVVRLKRSFVFDRLGPVHLTGRCLRASDRAWWVMRDMRVWGRLRRATGAVRLQSDM